MYAPKDYIFQRKNPSESVLRCIQFQATDIDINDERKSLTSETSVSVSTQPAGRAHSDSPCNQALDQICTQ